MEPAQCLASSFSTETLSHCLQTLVDHSERRDSHRPPPPPPPSSNRTPRGSSDLISPWQNRPAALPSPPQLRAGKAQPALQPKRRDANNNASSSSSSPAHRPRHRTRSACSETRRRRRHSLSHQPAAAQSGESEGDDDAAAADPSDAATKKNAVVYNGTAATVTATAAAAATSIKVAAPPGEAAKKNAKFRDALNSLLSSERRHSRVTAEPGFRHWSDAGRYIAEYRAFHQPPPPPLPPGQPQVRGGCDNDVPVAATASSDAVVKETAQNEPLTDAAVEKSAAQSQIAAAERQKAAGTTAQKCSKAKKGCPHYIPRIPCIRTNQSDADHDPSLSARAEPETITVPKMAVKGNQMEAGKNNAMGERGRSRFRFSKKQRNIIITTADQKCKKIFITWRQYLKYFSNKPNPLRRHYDGKQRADEDIDEKDVTGGYAERPGTPERSATPNRFTTSPTPFGLQRATTCVPVLNFDQSRVASPVSPFRWAMDQSAARRQKRAMSVDPSTKRRQKRFPPMASASQCLGTVDFRTESFSDFLSAAAEARKKAACDRSVGNGREMHVTVTEGGGFMRATRRTKLAICTVMDIQAAIEQLAASLGNGRPPAAACTTGSDHGG